MMAEKKRCKYFKPAKGNVDGRNGSGISIIKKYGKMQQIKIKRLI
jgi:hypothetical protein